MSKGPPHERDAGPGLCLSMTRAGRPVVVVRKGAGWSSTWHLGPRACPPEVYRQRGSVGRRNVGGELGGEDTGSPWTCWDTHLPRTWLGSRPSSERQRGPLSF